MHARFISITNTSRLQAEGNKTHARFLLAIVLKNDQVDSDSAESDRANASPSQLGGRNEMAGRVVIEPIIESVSSITTWLTQ